MAIRLVGGQMSNRVSVAAEVKSFSFSPRPPGQATGANPYFSPGGERG